MKKRGRAPAFRFSLPEGMGTCVAEFDARRYRVEHSRASLYPFGMAELTAPTSEFYLRFGDWDAEESHCFATGETEEGLSAFAVRRHEGKWDVVLGPWERAVEERPEYGDLTDTFQGWVAKMAKEAKQAWEEDSTFDPDIFIVTGDLVGQGYDGDPLLENVEIVERVGPDQLTATELKWTWLKPEAASATKRRLMR